MSIKKLFPPVFLILASIVGVATFLSRDNKSTEIDSASSDQQNFDQSDSLTISYQKLNVLPLRCIGCGKCARIDSTHFEMSDSKAIVVSSTNLDSSKLIMAINNCPVQAIVLE
ncbi:MAG: ferredoxin [Candidatus Shapirobacteria bacterium]|jgi:ferredoxin